MVTINDVVDIVRRRCCFTLEQYDVDTIYADKNKDKVKLTFNLSVDLTETELTKLAVQLNHIFEDVSDVYSVQVKNSSEYLKQKKFMWVIWKKHAGYLLT